MRITPEAVLGQPPFKWNKYFPGRLESALHILFWLFYFSAINVEWSANWFDRSLRLNTPSPFSVILFPFIFYAQILWLLPRLRDKKNWSVYLPAFALIYLLPEFSRLSLFVVFGDFKPAEEIFSRDSFLLGSPNLFWMSLVASVIYRFCSDWVNGQPAGELNHKPILVAKASKSSLSQQEARLLATELQVQMDELELYLNPDLSLRMLAAEMGVTDKKLSQLLNQHLNESFSSFVNKKRVQSFISRAEAGALQNLSIDGLAIQCGFPSKSSFYRSFKKITGQTPGSMLRQFSRN